MVSEYHISKISSETHRLFRRTARSGRIPAATGQTRTAPEVVETQTQMAVAARDQGISSPKAPRLGREACQTRRICVVRQMLVQGWVEGLSSQMALVGSEYDRWSE